MQSKPLKNSSLIFLKATLVILWLIISYCFIQGISQPIASIEKFYLFSNQFSLIGSMQQLIEDGKAESLFLFAIFVLFTIIFPLAKLITMAMQIHYYGKNWQNRMTKFIEALGHFSMLDVFIIALMVLLLKLDLLVNVSVHEGFYYFTVSIVLSTLLSFVLKYQRNKFVSSE